MYLSLIFIIQWKNEQLFVLKSILSSVNYRWVSNIEQDHFFKP